LAQEDAPSKEKTLFSGPQPGERLPPLDAKGVFGKQANQVIKLVTKETEDPTVIIFFHQLTRPAFGLTNAVMKYAGSRGKDGVKSHVVFLAEDTTEKIEWLKRVQRLVPEGVQYVVSTDGLEGPGSYGLNRNVTLTIITAKDGKVTANFALVQPSLQADAPKILQAINEIAGGGKVPTVESLTARPKMARTARNGEKPNAAKPDAPRTRPEARPATRDEELTGLLRAVINKQATPEQVQTAAAKVEAYIEKSENGKRELARISNTVVHSGKLSNYGTETAQTILTKWAKELEALAPTRKEAGSEKATDQPRKRGDKKQD
jgi:hypothetical protein